MRRSMQDLVDQVGAESWDHYLPAPAAVRDAGQSGRRSQPRSLAVVAVAAVVTAAVVVPAVVARHLGTDSGIHPRPASSALAAAPREAPCGPPAAGLAAQAKAQLTEKGLLTTADAVPGYTPGQRIAYLPQPVTSLLDDSAIIPGVEVGQEGSALSSIQATAYDGTGWQLTHELIRYAPGGVAAGYDAAAAGIRSHKVTVVVDRGGSEPQLIVKQAVFEAGPAPKAADWGVVTRWGDCMSVIEMWSMGSVADVPSDGPGLAYLEAVGAAARAKAEGTHVSKLPLPGHASASAQAAKGYLGVPDLGPGAWRVDTAIGSHAPSTVALATASCGEGASVPVTGGGPLQLYAGVTSDYQDWQLTEQVLRMSAESARQVITAERLQATASCATSLLAASPSGVGDEMIITHRKAQANRYEATDAWIRTGGTIIHLQIFASTSTESSVAIPGVNAYLTSVARAAVTQAKAN